ncbi:olfactory receptor 10A7-like [Aquarana catesbeiana]|uniref:olfactory receptor 10A7-like n=1 Tax=Aquarana catesbeiana TaxID=8400 RepID=UPI003CCA3900
MCEDNNTRVTEVVLHGFQNLSNYNIVFFCVLLLIFLVILVGNILIITLISIIPLRHPMYFFLKHLSIVDVLFTSNIVPALLHVILWGQSHLSITGCIFQYYVHSFLAFIQSFLLTVMAYDRYVAICDPLHYSTLITTKTCYYLVCSSWILSYILISSEIIFLYQLQFCKTNYIDHFFCDIAPILQISSSDTFIIIWIDFVICFLTIFFPFVLVIGSYTCIFINILKMSSVVRKKAFSTCSSHLLIVCLYYGTLTAIYAVPSGDNSHNENKFKSLIYTVLTPFINPIIYSLRNQEIIEDLEKLISQHIWARN